MIETANDIIAALRSIIADYEQRLSGTVEPGKAAPAKPVPRTPAGAATISIEDMGREVAMRGRSEFLEWYYQRSDDERRRLQTISSEIKELYANVNS